MTLRNEYGFQSECTSLASAKVLGTLHFREEFQVLTKHAIIGREEVKPVIWPPGYIKGGTDGGCTDQVYPNMKAQRREKNDPTSADLWMRFLGFGNVSTSHLFWTGSPSHKALQLYRDPGIRLRSSGSVASTFTHGAISPALKQLLNLSFIFEFHFRISRPHDTWVSINHKQNLNLQSLFQIQQQRGIS